MRKAMGTSARPEGWELAIALLRASRAIVDSAHSGLAERGHSDARPAYGYILQLVNAGCTTVTELATQVGISSQGVGQIVDEMVARNYLSRAADPADRRRRRLALDGRGFDLLERSAEEFGRVRDEWQAAVGEDRLIEIYAALVALIDQHEGAHVLRPLW